MFILLEQKSSQKKQNFLKCHFFCIIKIKKSVLKVGAIYNKEKCFNLARFLLYKIKKAFKKSMLFIYRKKE